MKTFSDFKLAMSHKCLCETVLSGQGAGWRLFWNKAPKRNLKIQCLLTGTVSFRDCALIVVANTLAWADVVTGTLYSVRTGRSYTGSRVALEPNSEIKTLHGRPKITHRALIHGPKIPKRSEVAA